MTRAALAKVHIAKKDLQIPDDAYRAMLQRLTGHSSARDCTEAQLATVLEELKAKGWKPTFKVVSSNPKAAGKGRAPASSPVARKARAMWISLHQLGVVRNPSEAALEAFACSQLKVDALVWANQSHGFRLIEALKDMAERAGWLQGTPGVTDPEGKAVVLKMRLQALLDAKAAEAE